LAWSFVVSDRLAEIEAVGYVIWAYRPQGGWTGIRQSGDPLSLAGGGLAQQPARIWESSWYRQRVICWP
jgi:hypothetical protein